MLIVIMLNSNEVSSMLVLFASVVSQPYRVSNYVLELPTKNIQNK